LCSVYCVGLNLDPFLHAGDQHGVLDYVGLYIHPLLLAGDLHGVLEGFLLQPLLHAGDYPVFLE